MTASLCPLCQSPLVLFSRREVECKGWNCQFSIPLDDATIIAAALWNCQFSIPLYDATIIAAALAHHMRPLAEPHPFKANPDYPGQCDEAVGNPVQPCNRPKECH